MFEINPVELPFIPAQSGTTWDNAGIDLEGHVAADIGVFRPSFKYDVVLAGCLITEGIAGVSATPQVRFDRRFTAGSDTGRTDGDVGDIKMGVTGVSAAGEVAYDLVGVGKSLEPGMEVVVQLLLGTTGAGKAGKIWPMLWVRYRPETMANLTAMQATA